MSYPRLGALPPVAFFSFAEITDPDKHRAFNEYHQLDHRPANLALPGVFYGERFVRTPACREASVAPDPRYERFHYFNYYLFRDDSPETRAEWTRLGSLAAYWGRKPDHAWSERTMGFYRTLKGYAAPRVRVAPEVVPIRPAAGVYVTIQELGGPPDGLEELGRWMDTVHIPALLEGDGVAGAFTFVSEDGFPVDRVASAAAGSHPTMAVVLFLDGDPLAVAADIGHRHEAGALGPPWEDEGVARLLFAGPLETIVPWQWEWFD
jgi:hypothetical protein